MAITSYLWRSAMGPSAHNLILRFSAHSPVVLRGIGIFRGYVANVREKYFL